MTIRRAFSQTSWALLLLSLACPGVFGQGAKVTSPLQSPAEGESDQPREREQWFMKGRTAPPGQSAAALRYRAHQQKLQMRAARLNSANTARSATATPLAAPSGPWTALGPAPMLSDSTTSAHTGGDQDYGPVSGRATSVVVDPADTTGNTVYVGGAFGGLWKSTNAASGSFGNPSAVTWTPLLDNQATLAVGAIALQPGNSNVILVGTGEANSSGDSYYGLGILRSSDGGGTWTLIQSADAGAHPFKGLAFSKIAFSTANPNLVVAATAASTVGIQGGAANGTTRGLYVSTDGGQTWSLATVKDGTTPIAAGSATSVIYNAAAGKFFAAMRFHGIYSSSDGLNWTRLASQPGGTNLSTTACPASPTSPNCPIYRGEFAVVPGRNEMYVWYVDATEADQGIYRSPDGGGTWTPINESGIAPPCGDSFGCGTSQGTYNLELAAVPSGAGTDLYAGAINLFKCSLSSGGTSCTQGSWLNLTHVYGCTPVGSLSHVHPDQHGVAFMVAGGKDIMYFTNDGGIYRALDGYTGLMTGTCGAGPNQFDSLNGTLGSMTQFVSFSQHPTDANTILGGTQDNGSPATGTALSSSQWVSVNGGDGGFNEINPSSPLEWFTANYDVSIQRCTQGINCLGQNFPYVVRRATVGGDHGAFYTPYMLDPQVAISELIVGTCRVWRGPGAGGTYTALSNDFEPGAVPPCTGGEFNLVRSLAAGGPKDANGFSNVIYAGTNGTGPLDPAPAGGNVFVTSNAAGGASTWQNVTGTINPNHYPVSSIAIDTSDATGKTAYVTIMGFGVSHVWQTTNAGASWTNFTSNLPDAPVNSSVVDAATGNVYVGTDVGVFVSSTSSASWTEVGPVSGPGFLPNVPVTKLRIFNTSTTKILRASTYGRGVWDFVLVAVPDFQISISNTPLTAYPSQTVTLNGTLTALNGYSSTVTLSCTAGTTTPPPTCTPSPASATPSAGGTAFTVGGSSGTVSDYVFNVHAVGSDASTTTHDASVTLHVVDFSLGAPNPSSVTVNRPNTSAPITLAVTALGSFNDTVMLSCASPPVGVTCNFSPNPVSPGASATLTISTSTNTPAATTSLTISAQAVNIPAPSPKTQNVSLTVTANPDYTLTANAGSQSTLVNQNLQLSGALTAFNGYNSAVNLACTAGGTAPPPTCSASPSAVIPTTGGAAFTMTVGSSAAGTYNFNITGVGTDAGTITHSVPVSLTVNPDFTVSNGSGTQTVKPGQTASYTLNFAPVGATTFASPVTYACSGLPALTQCSFNPTQIAGGSGATAVTLSISTVGPNAAPVRQLGRANRLLLPLGISALGLALAGFTGNRRGRGWRGVLGLPAAVILTGLLLACGGGGGNSPPPPPPVTVTISPTSKSLFPGQTQQFTATVSGATNTQVTWKVNGTTGGDATTGTISTSGLYTAPAAVPSPATVPVSATSQADATKSASASVTISPPTVSGTYTITVNATSGSLSHSTTVTLTVQ